MEQKSILYNVVSHKFYDLLNFEKRKISLIESNIPIYCLSMEIWRAEIVMEIISSDVWLFFLVLSIN